MAIEVELPDGSIAEFPDGMPPEAIKQVIGKKFPKPANAVADAGEQLIRGVNRGIDALVSLPGAIVGGAVNLVAPGQGDRFKWNNPVSEFMRSPQAQPQTDLGRYADAAGQAIGASAIPTMGMMARAGQAAGPAAQTTLGAIGQQAVQSYRVAPGAAVRADLAAAAGSGVGQQAAQDMGFGTAGQMAGGVIGGVVPGLVQAGARTITQPARQALANQGEGGAYGTVARQLPEGGIDQFADDVSVGASNRNQRIQRRTLDILGEEMVRADGNVRRAEVATIRRIVQETGAAPATAADQLRRLREVHANSNLMFGEYPAVARSDVDTRLQAAPALDDVGRVQASGTQETMDYLANAGSNASATAVRNAVTQRQEALGPAMRQTLEGMAPQVGGRPAMIDDAADMIEQARQAGSAAYQAAYRGPIHNWELVNRLPRVLQAARNFAAGRAGDVRDAMNRAIDQFLLPTPNGPVAMGTLQQLQDARAVLRDQIQGLRAAGNNAAAGAVTRLRDQITQIMQRASPDWRVANDQWADMNFLVIGQELGDAFATRAGPQFRRQLEEFRRLAPQAQDIVRIHFLQKLYDKLDNLNDTNSVSKLFANDHNRRMIRDLFGDDAAVAFTRAIRDQRAAEGTQRMMGGSQTAQRLARREQMEGEAGLVSALQNANAGAIRKFVMDLLARVTVERRNRPMADILTTPMSDTPRVAQHIARMRQQQQRLDRLNQPPPLRVPIGGRLAPMLNPMMDEEGTR